MRDCQRLSLESIETGQSRGPRQLAGDLLLFTRLLFMMDPSLDPSAIGDELGVDRPVILSVFIRRTHRPRAGIAGLRSVTLPFNKHVPWPEGLNKYIRFSKEMMLLCVARKPG